MSARSYPDLVVQSTNGAFRLEARSPYNLPKGHPDRKTRPALLGREDRWPTFQTDFQFTLYWHDTDQAAWTLDQARVSRRSPGDLHVSDRGWSVVQTVSHGESDLVGISPRGEVTVSLGVVAALRADSRSSEYIVQSSIGPLWAGQSQAWFATLDGREHFWVRTWWGYRILLDLERGERADPAGHRAAIVAHEEAWVAETLGSFDPEASEGSEPWLTAITLAGRSGLAKVGALIQPFEELDKIWSTSTCRTLSRDGTNFGGHFSTYLWRPFAKLALRRLRVQPRGFATYAFPRPDEEDGFLALPEHIDDMDTRVQDVVQHMPVLDVLAVLGSPDLIEGREWCWDTEHDTTIRVEFAEGEVKSIETLKPPGWIVEADREGSWIFLG